MRFRTMLLFVLAVILLACGTALGEEAAKDSIDSISYEEWDWDNESVNAFTGSVDLSPWSGTELTVELKAVFEPASKSAAEVAPKFTHFNGSRLTMLEQSSTIACTPGAEAVAFSGSLQMPEKDHYQKIRIDLTAKDPSGKELKKISMTVSKGGDTSTENGNIFYIPFEIRTVAIIIAAAAAVIWCIAVIRNRVLNRKK